MYRPLGNPAAARTWRPRSGIGVVLIVLIAAHLHGVARGQGRVTTPQDALAGSRVYGSKGCARCHAVNGLGGVEGPDLARLPTGRSFFDLAAAMWNHLPQMSARMQELGIEQPRLSERDVGNLMAFLYWLDYFDSPGDAGRGETLFSEKQCIVCHQLGGVGGVGGPSLDHEANRLSPIELATDLWNHGPAMTAAMEARGLRRPQLTASDLSDLLAYLERTQPRIPSTPLHVIPGASSVGQELFSSKSCVQCHPVREGTGGGAPALAPPGAHPSLLGFAAAMWNKAPRMTTAMQRRGIAVPQLSVDEMADIVGYLYTADYLAEGGDVRRGAQRLRTAGCLGCHALNGSGGSGGVDFSQVRWVETAPDLIAAMWNHILIAPTQVPGGAWPQLDAAAVADVAAFFRERASGR